MAFDYNLAASKYFIDRTADHHVVSVGNVKTNASGAISVSVAFNVDAEGKITYSEPQIYHKYAGDDTTKANNLYKTFACLDADLVGTWANPTVGAKQTIDGKECEVIEILDPSANYEKFTLNNFGKFVLCKGVAGGMDTDAVAIDNASDEKDDEKVMTARAIEKSLAWENVNGKIGSIVSYIKNKEGDDPIGQPTVAGDCSIAFGWDDKGGDVSKAEGEFADIVFNGSAIGDYAVAINGNADGTSDDLDQVKKAVAIDGSATGYMTAAIVGEAEGDGAVAINGKANGKTAVAIGTRGFEQDGGDIISDAAEATAEGAVAIRGNASGKDSLAVNFGQAEGELSIAFGKGSIPDDPEDGPVTADGKKSIAINGSAIGEKAVSINAEFTRGASAIGVGDGVEAIGEKAIALNGIARGKRAIAINGKAEGKDNAAVDYAIAIGGEVVYDPGTPDEERVANSAKNPGSIAIGAGAMADSTTNESAIAIGKESFAEGWRSIAIGERVEANYVEIPHPFEPSETVNAGSIAIGASSNGASVAIGSGASEYGVSIGFENECAKHAVAVGHAVSTNNYSIAIGNDLRTERHNQAVIGTKNGGEAYGEEGEVPVGWLAPIFTIANGDQMWTKEEKPGDTTKHPDFSRPETDPNDPDYEYNAEFSNALDVMANGDLYLMGIGGYNGQNLARQGVVKDDDEKLVIDPLTNKPIKLVKPVQDVIFEMQKKIEYLEGIIEHITEIINN